MSLAFSQIYLWDLSVVCAEDRSDASATAIRKLVNSMRSCLRPGA